MGIRQRRCKRHRRHRAAGQLAGESQFTNGTQVYILPKGGLFAGASVNGQKFKFMGNNQTSDTTVIETKSTATH